MSDLWGPKGFPVFKIAQDLVEDFRILRSFDEMMSHVYNLIDILYKNRTLLLVCTTSDA